jgi:hypothetical protein
MAPPKRNIRFSLKELGVNHNKQNNNLLEHLLPGVILSSLYLLLLYLH